MARKLELEVVYVLILFLRRGRVLTLTQFLPTRLTVLTDIRIGMEKLDNEYFG
jgi:hypothetical protein